MDNVLQLVTEMVIRDMFAIYGESSLKVVDGAFVHTRVREAYDQRPRLPIDLFDYNV